MKFTGERVIPAFEGNVPIGDYKFHEKMYQEFLPITSGTVVDVACGCGYGSKLLAEKANKVYGYDISKEAIDFAETYYNAPNIEYAVADIRSLPLENQSVDMVISVETFEHVTEIETVISEVHRILKPNCFWCFSTPNTDRYPDHKIVPWHVKHYTKHEIHALLDAYFNISIHDTGIEYSVSKHFRKPVFSNCYAFCIKK